MTVAEFGLVCGGGYVAGKEIMALELAQGFQSSGRSVHLVTSSWNDRDFTSRLASSKLSFEVLPLGFISATLNLECLRMTGTQLRRWPGLVRGYRSFLRTVQPRTVIHTNWHHLILLWLCLRSHRDLFWVHEVIPDSRHYRIAFRVLALRLRYFVSVSHAVGESLRRLGIPEHQIRMIHNGVTAPDESTTPGEGSNGRIRLGIVGQIGEWKGHDDLVHAFGKILTQWPDTELHIFGHGQPDYEGRLKTAAAGLGIAHRVTWHGFTSDRAAIFSNLDVCIVPSRSQDPLPTVAIEAAGYGLPVVATHQGGLPEIIEDGVTGILVPPKNAGRLAEAIGQLLANPGLRREMGTRARQRMRTHFSTDRFLKEFLTLMETRPESAPGHRRKSTA